VLLSPTPYVTPIAANSDEYVVLLTAAPLHSNQPVGIVTPANAVTAPVGDEASNCPLLTAS